MVRAPCVDKNGMKKGAWSEDEDKKLRNYIERYGHLNWRELPKYAGLSRCGKSCRLRWVNYLSPNVKHGNYTKEEEDLIIELHSSLGNKWSAIAAKLPGRSDNEIKNYWHTNLKKRGRKLEKASGNDHIQKPESNEANPRGKAFKTLDIKVIDEAKILLEVLSSGTSSASSSSSSSSSSTELSSSLSLSGSDCAVSNGASSQPFDYESIENFWTEPFISETDSIKLDEHLVSPLEFVSSSNTEMMMVDDFLWSTMDLYCEYDTWLMN